MLLLAVLIAADQLTKLYFTQLLKDGEDSVVIDKFFYFTYTLNTGSAYGLFSDKPWARTFFLIITPVAIAFFTFFYIYAFKKGHKLLMVALMLIIGGALGNYIDRAAFGAVTDFICLEIGGNRIFGIFNPDRAFNKQCQNRGFEKNKPIREGNVAYRVASPRQEKTGRRRFRRGNLEGLFG